MSILFSVLALSGDKAAAVQSARDEFIAAAALAIKDGNTRNLDDTAARMRENGAVTKNGEFAKSKKGAILAAFLGAMNGAASARNAYLANHKGFKGKATAAMVEQATAAACLVGDAFEAAIIAATAPKKTAPAAPKEAPAAEQEAPAAEQEAPAAEQEAPKDDFNLFMNDAIRALGRDAIRALIAAAIDAEKATAAEQEAPAAPKKARRAA